MYIVSEQVVSRILCLVWLMSTKQSLLIAPVPVHCSSLTFTISDMH